MDVFLGKIIHRSSEIPNFTGHPPVFILLSLATLLGRKERIRKIRVFLTIELKLTVWLEIKRPQTDDPSHSNPQGRSLNVHRGHLRDVAKLLVLTQEVQGGA